MKHKWSVCITAGLTVLLLIGAAGLYLERPRTALEMTVKDEPSSAAESAAVQVTALTTASTVKTQTETVTEVTKPVETALPEHDLNRASAADLMRVPGIGEALAAEIVAARTACGGFTSRTQLCEISGIGETLIARELNNIPNEKTRAIAAKYLEEVHAGKRDFRF